MLHEKGPSQEDDLMEALTPLQAQLILQAYGTLSAFKTGARNFMWCTRIFTRLSITRSPITKQIASVRSLPARNFHAACFLQRQRMPAAHGGLWRRTSVRECQLIDLQHLREYEEEDEQEEPRMKDAAARCRHHLVVCHELCRRCRMLAMPRPRPRDGTLLCSSS